MSWSPPSSPAPDPTTRASVAVGAGGDEFARIVGPPLWWRLFWVGLWAFVGGMAGWIASDYFRHTVRYWEDHGGYVVRQELTRLGWVMMTAIAVGTAALLWMVWRRTVRVDAQQVVKRHGFRTSDTIPLRRVKQISVLATDGQHGRVNVQFDSIKLTLLPGRSTTAKVRQIRSWAQRSDVAFALLPGGPMSTWRLAIDLDQPLVGETALPPKPPRRLAATLIAFALALIGGGLQFWFQYHSNDDPDSRPPVTFPSLNLPASIPANDPNRTDGDIRSQADVAFAALDDPAQTIDCSRAVPVGPLDRVRFVRIELGPAAMHEQFEAARRPGRLVEPLDQWAIGELVSSGAFEATQSHAPIFGQNREMWVLTEDGAFRFDCSEFEGF